MTDRIDEIQSLLAQAWKARGLGDYERAKKKVDAAHSQCKVSDHDLLGRVFHIYMQFEYDQNEFEAALGLARQSLDHYEKGGNPHQLAHSRRHIADLMLHLDRLESAEKEYQQVIQIYRSLANFHEMDLANALRGYALLLEKKNKSIEAVIVWKEARGLYDKYKIAEGVQEADQHLAKLSGLSQ